MAAACTTATRRRGVLLVALALAAGSTDATARAAGLAARPSVRAKGGTVTVGLRSLRGGVCRLTVSRGRRRPAFPPLHVDGRGRAALRFRAGRGAPRGAWTFAGTCHKG